MTDPIKSFREYVVGNDNNKVRYLTDAFNKLLESHPYHKGSLYDKTMQAFASGQIPTLHVVQARPNKKDEIYAPLEKQVLSARDIDLDEAYRLIQGIPVKMIRLSRKNREVVVGVNSENLVYPFSENEDLKFLGCDGKKSEEAIVVGDRVMMIPVVTTHAMDVKPYRVEEVKKVSYPEFKSAISDYKNLSKETEEAIKNIKLAYQKREERFLQELEEAKKRELAQAGEIPDLHDVLKKQFFGGEGQ
jgi:hypothetical protein